MNTASPLRYPGGKWRVTKLFESIIEMNGLRNCHYVEPYAGGAGLALNLLYREQVAEVHLNDLDKSIHAFWYSVFNHHQEFIDLVINTPVNLEEWENQKIIFNKGVSVGMLDLGFATFYLNRTNHSGILKGGIIGGKSQSGKWKIDARFNVAELVKRLGKVYRFRSRIHLTCEDALVFVSNSNFHERSLIYLDPPYYKAGKRLYLNAYKPDDHASVSRCVQSIDTPWIVSYDDTPEIRTLYENVPSRQLNLLHNAAVTTSGVAKSGKEVLFFAPNLRIPTILS